MQKQFTTSKGSFELTDKYNPDYIVTISNPFIYSVKETHKLIGKVSELTEEQAKEVVDLYPDCIKHYEDYCTYAYPYNEAISSFQTLLKSLSIKNNTDLYLFKILEI